MTHEYKVGDKGKTKFKHNYEVVYAGMLLVVRIGSFGDREAAYTLGGSPHNGYAELIPPKRRIKGWINIHDTPSKNCHCGYVYSSKELAITEMGTNTIACVEIDIEEGEGL